jgi:hypothetical protein
MNSDDVYHQAVADSIRDSIGIQKELDAVEAAVNSLHLKLLPVPGEGDCGFEAVCSSDVATSGHRNELQLRTDWCDFMAGKLGPGTVLPPCTPSQVLLGCTTFQEFIRETGTGIQNGLPGLPDYNSGFDEYIGSMSKAGVYADSVVMAGLSLMLECSIRIITREGIIIMNDRSDQTHFPMITIALVTAQRHYYATHVPLLASVLPVTSIDDFEDDIIVDEEEVLLDGICDPQCPFFQCKVMVGKGNENRHLNRKHISNLLKGMSDINNISLLEVKSRLESYFDVENLVLSFDRVWCDKCPTLVKPKASSHGCKEKDWQGKVSDFNSSSSTFSTRLPSVSVTQKQKKQNNSSSTQRNSSN